MIYRIFRPALTLAVFGIGSVVNPTYLMGCTADTDTKERHEQARADLLGDLAALNEQRAFAFTARDGNAYEVILTLSQAKRKVAASAHPASARFGSRAYACGTETFFQSASACATQYELAVEGTLSLRDVETDDLLVTDYLVEGRISSFGGTTTLSGSDDPAAIVTLDPRYTPDQETAFEVSFFAGAKLDADAAHVQLNATL